MSKLVITSLLSTVIVGSVIVGIGGYLFKNKCSKNDQIEEQYRNEIKELNDEILSRSIMNMQSISDRNREIRRIHKELDEPRRMYQTENQGLNDIVLERNKEIAALQNELYGSTQRLKLELSKSKIKSEKKDSKIKELENRLNQLMNSQQQQQQQQ